MVVIDSSEILHVFAVMSEVMTIFTLNQSSCITIASFYGPG